MVDLPQSNSGPTGVTSKKWLADEGRYSDRGGVRAVNTFVPVCCVHRLGVPRGPEPAELSDRLASPTGFDTLWTIVSERRVAAA